MGDKVGKLDDVITELEGELKNIKSFSQVLKKLDQTSESIAQLNNKVVINVKAQVSATESIQQSADVLKSRLDELGTIIHKSIQELYKDNQNNQKEMDDSLRIRLEKFSFDIENKIEGISKQSQGIDKNILDMNEKLTLVLDAYQQDRNRGLLARLFNK